jgi:DnaJ-class molecular chaperone
MINYYDILNIKNTATISEIKKAYKHLAIKFHPDKTNNDLIKKEKFIQITEAYEILKDSKKKKRYDIMYASYNSSIFHAKRFEQTIKENTEKLDISVTLIISLRDVYSKETIEIKYKKKTYIDNDIELIDTVYLLNIKNIRKSKKINIKNQGHQSKYYKDKIGTLKINVVYKNVKDYRIIDDALFYNLDIHFQDAIDGIIIDYLHLDNSIIKINVPKKTNNGDKIIISEKGLLVKNKRQDLILIINIVIDYDRL